MVVRVFLQKKCRSSALAGGKRIHSKGEKFRDEFSSLCRELKIAGYSSTVESFGPVKLGNEFQKFLLEDTFLLPSASAFQPFGLGALKKAAKENRQRGFILLDEEQKQIASVRTYGVVRNSILKEKSSGKRLPYIQHVFPACSIRESKKIPEELHDRLIHESYGLLMLGSRIKILLEKGLANVKTDARHLALVLLVAENIFRHVPDLGVRFWLRSKDGSEVENAGFKAKEVSKALGRASPSRLSR